MRDDFTNLSERKLMDCLMRLGYDIEISVRPARTEIGHLMSAAAHGVGHNCREDPGSLPPSKSLGDFWGTEFCGSDTDSAQSVGTDGINAL